MPFKKQPEVGDLWTPKHIQILKQWKAKAFVQLWLHDNSAYYYMFINIWFTYPIIIISAACSATVLVNDSGIVRLVVGIFSFINAVLTAVSKQIGPGGTMQDHLMMSKRYNNLIRNVDTCLCLTESMRPHPSVFIERVGMEIDNLADNMLTPPGYVVAKFEKIFGTLDRMLYGEHVFELMKIEIQTSTMMSKVRRRSELFRTNQDMPNDVTDIEMGRNETLNSMTERATTRSCELPMSSVIQDKTGYTRSETVINADENLYSALSNLPKFTLKDRPINICHPLINTNVWTLKSGATDTGHRESIDGTVADDKSNVNTFSMPAKSPMHSPFTEIKSMRRDQIPENN